jgi:hypothetical protein
VLRDCQAYSGKVPKILILFRKLEFYHGKQILPVDFLEETGQAHFIHFQKGVCKLPKSE